MQRTEIALVFTTTLRLWLAVVNFPPILASCAVGCVMNRISVLIASPLAGIVSGNRRRTNPSVGNVCLACHVV